MLKWEVSKQCYSRSPRVSIGWKAQLTVKVPNAQLAHLEGKTKAYAEVVR